MSLTLPTVSVTLGPTWATQLNAALELIDAHDHSSGKGTRIKTSGLDINADLSFGDFKATDLVSTQYTDQDATLAGASNSSSVYSKDGDLYWTNGSGVAVQVTSGASVITSAASLETVATNEFSADVTIAPSDAYVVLNMDMSAARQVTLPLASAVAAGRIYVIKDATGQAETNTLTVAKQGSDTIDGATSQTITSNYGSIFVVGDGSSKWRII